MELRYLGFDQRQNSLAFRFEVFVKGATTMKAVVVADMALFLEYRVGIQDGPNLCAARLTADLEQKIEKIQKQLGSCAHEHLETPRNPVTH